jgi:hypothetical protein
VKPEAFLKGYLSKNAAPNPVAALAPIQADTSDPSPGKAPIFKEQAPRVTPWEAFRNTPKVQAVQATNAAPIVKGPIGYPEQSTSSMYDANLAALKKPAVAPAATPAVTPATIPGKVKQNTLDSNDAINFANQGG